MNTLVLLRMMMAATRNQHMIANRETEKNVIRCASVSVCEALVFQIQGERKRTQKSSSSS